MCSPWFKIGWCKKGSVEANSWMLHPSNIKCADSMWYHSCHLEWQSLVFLLVGGPLLVFTLTASPPFNADPLPSKVGCATTLCTDLPSATFSIWHFYNQCLFNSFCQVIWLECESKDSRGITVSSQDGHPKPARGRRQLLLL